jgi:NAD(P)-dependent dehydrogenase (short-subunit alcohol dehydrogenase family)
VKFDGSVAVVTGAARGIGRALCREFQRRGAAGIVVIDRDGAAAQATAAELGGFGLPCDVTDAEAIGTTVSDVIEKFGRVDLWVSNAGFGCEALDLDDPLSSPDATWQRMWDVHVMSHVHAGRAVIPVMLERGCGHFVNVASAAGLLSQVGDTPYSVTKHAAVALAESLAIAYGDRGVNISVVCPQYVATAITGLDERIAEGAIEGVQTVEQAAGAIADGIEQDRFLILTHPEVLGYFQRKAADYERWLVGMRRIRDGARSGGFLKVKSRPPVLD